LLLSECSGLLNGRKRNSPEKSINFKTKDKSKKIKVEKVVGYWLRSEINEQQVTSNKQLAISDKQLVTTT